MLVTVCIEAGRRTLTHTSWTGLAHGSRLGAILVLVRRERQHVHISTIIAARQFAALPRDYTKEPRPNRAVVKHEHC